MHPANLFPWMNSWNDIWTQGSSRYFIWKCEDYYPQRVLATELDDQTATLPGDDVAYGILNAWEVMKVDAGQIMTASL